MEMEMEMEMEMKKRHDEVSTTTTYNTPYDILVKIFSRLPAMSLLQLRWTCKYWFNLITRDPYFLKMHLHYSSFSSSRYPSVLSTSFKISLRPEFQHCHLITDTNYKSYLSRQVKVLDPFNSPADFQLLATCHGLLLFLSRAHLRFCIWNPCTKEYKLLRPPPPPPRTIVNRGIQAARHIYGVGYDSSIDDYKVIRNSYFYKDTHLLHKGRNESNEYDMQSSIGSSVQVYRLGTNTWTSIGGPNAYNLLSHNYKTRYVSGSLYSKGGCFAAEEDYDYCKDQAYHYHYQEGGVFVNGALYWMDLSNNNKKKIISFDLAKETYQELSNQPEYFHLNLQEMRLHLFEGSLCLVLKSLDATTSHECFWEMWVMKDDRSNNSNQQEPSWTKLCKIVQYLQYNDPDPVMKPLRITNNGEILLLKNGTHFVLCYPKMSGFIRTLIPISCKGGYYAYVKEVYNESLVYLNSGTYAVGQEHNQEKKKIEEDNEERTEIKEQMKKKKRR